MSFSNYVDEACESKDYVLLMFKFYGPERLILIIY
jgi:hypothetical protein